MCLACVLRLEFYRECFIQERMDGGTRSTRFECHFRFNFAAVPFIFGFFDLKIFFSDAIRNAIGRQPKQTAAVRQSITPRTGLTEMITANSLLFMAFRLPSRWANRLAQNVIASRALVAGLHLSLQRTRMMSFRVVARSAKAVMNSKWRISSRINCRLIRSI